MDEGHKETDDLIEALEKKIARVYSQALREMKTKQAEFMEEFAKELDAMNERLKSGEITEREFKDWLEDQNTNFTWRANMIDTLAGDLVEADKKAAEIIAEELPKTFVLNANYATYQIERSVGVSLNFSLYDLDTVNELLEKEPDLLPKPDIDIEKDKRWNRQKLTSAITQSILQGEGIMDTAKRISSVAQMDANAAVRNARTMMTAAQNNGRQKSYERAQENGVEIQKEWVATLDKRTRRSHRRLDGERVGINEKFSNECAFPGDPEGPKSEVYNCRCTMKAHFVGDKYQARQRFSRLKDVTYEEWKEGKNGRSG